MSPEQIDAVAREVYMAFHGSVDPATASAFDQESTTIQDCWRRIAHHCVMREAAIHTRTSTAQSQAQVLSEAVTRQAQALDLMEVLVNRAGQDKLSGVDVETAQSLIQMCQKLARVALLAYTIPE